MNIDHKRRFFFFFLFENSLTPTPIGITFQQPKRSCRREKGAHLEVKRQNEVLAYAAGPRCGVARMRGLQRIPKGDKVRFLIMRTACAQIRAFHAHHTSRATNFNSKLEIARSRFAFLKIGLYLRCTF
eukprot:sb/3475327/